MTSSCKTRRSTAVYWLYNCTKLDNKNQLRSMYSDTVVDLRVHIQFDPSDANLLSGCFYVETQRNSISFAPPNAGIINNGSPPKRSGQ